MIERISKYFVIIAYIAIVLFFCWLSAGMMHAEGNAPINYGTKTHVVKKPPSVDGVMCDFDFTGLEVCGIEGSGIGTVTTFAAGNLSPLFTTTVLNPDTQPALSFAKIATGAHTYYGNNTAGLEVPAFHVIDYSEIDNTPTLVTTFLGLTDTPDSYIGEANKLVTVKGDESGLEFTTAPATPTPAPSPTRKVTFVVDAAGGVLTTGAKNPTKILEGGTLQGWLLIAKPVGSVTVDVLRAADGGDPVTSIIGGGTKPALSSARDNSSTSFPSWTSTTLTAKDNLTISLSGISTVTYCALTLYYQ